MLGSLVCLHYLGVMTLLSDHRGLTTTWYHYQYAPDGGYRTVQGAVSLDFWVSIFSMQNFFFITVVY
jgi:hypothetical protein